MGIGFGSERNSKEAAMRRDGGSTLMLVILLSTVMVLTSLGLVTLSQKLTQTSFGLNQQTLCRYAAEGGIERVKFHLKRAQDTLTDWVGPKIAAAQPCMTFTVGSANVEVSLASLGGDKYKAVSKAKVGGNSIAMSMIFRYEYSSGASTPLNSFSKYVFFTNGGGTWAGGIVGGYAHMNGDITWRYSLSAQGRQTHLKAVTSGGRFLLSNDTGTWTSADWDAMFPDPQVKAESQANTPIDMPSYASIDTDLRTAATAMPPELFVDPSSAAYAATFANPAYTDFISVVQFTFSGGTSNAVVNLHGWNGSSWVLAKSNTVPIVPGVPTLIYSTPRVTNVKGVLRGQVTLTTPYVGTSQVDQNGITAYNNPSIRIIDDLILVDAAGNPKHWVYNSSNQPVAQSTKWGLNSSIPTNSTTNIETMTSTWDGVNYTYKQNPLYSDGGVKNILGLMANGDIQYRDSNTTKKNAVLMSAYYSAHPNARWYAYNETGTAENYNIGIGGSRVSSRAPIVSYGTPGGFTRGVIRYYDEDLLHVPPPYWVQIVNSPAFVTLEFGAVHVGS
jgi:hypothetical protein